MSLFKIRKKSLTINKKETTYRVRYLGNVQTTMMKGDGCVDRPTAALWNNYLKTSNPGLEMKMNVVNSGLKVHTKQQGITEYWANRITYCIAHPKYPKLFVWVYRHEGKKLKHELRCHAALCHSEKRAKQIADCLQERISVALHEFLREKTRRQNARITLQKTNSWSTSTSSQPLRKKLLSPASYFRPPVERSSSAPKLGNITETDEGWYEEAGGVHSHVTFVGANMETLMEEEDEDSDLESPFSNSPDHRGSQGRSDTDDLVTLTDRLDISPRHNGHVAEGGPVEDDGELMRVELVVIGEDPGEVPIMDDCSAESGFFESDAGKHESGTGASLSTINETAAAANSSSSEQPREVSALNNNIKQTQEQMSNLSSFTDKDVVINNKPTTNGTAHTPR